MNLQLRVVSPTDTSRDAVILTSYGRGAVEGRNLATSGYSYDFVVRVFRPLLEEWGQVHEVLHPERDLEPCIEQLRQAGLRPVHVSIRALQHVHLSRRAPNVVVPAWEFPDIPDHGFDNNPCNNWVRVANACSLVIVSGPYTMEALTRGGVRTPIRIVPVPNPSEYFDVPRWDRQHPIRLDCAAYDLPRNSPSCDIVPVEEQDPLVPPSDYHAPFSWRGLAHRRYRRHVRPWLPKRLHNALGAAYHAWRRPISTYEKSPNVELSGIVYTSIFAPADGRKNWEDLVSGFLIGLGDAADATLVLKLITNDPAITQAVLAHYRRLDIRHRCRVVIIDGFLSHEQMLRLAEATTYYVTTTRAEGNCLPLMNHLAAARPAVSPRHTAIGDYFDGDVGFVVESHPEPAAWPQDTRLRCSTFWQRLVWPSFVLQLRRSLRVARSMPARYDALAAEARSRMLNWASVDAVRPRLFEALALAAGSLPEADKRAPSFRKAA